MNKKMIIAGLRARPVRTTVSILAVTLEVVLILVIVGLTTGIAEETARRTAGVGAEIMVQPANSSVFLALNSNTMPLSIGDQIAKLPAVKAVTPVQVMVNSGSGLEVIYGLDPASFYAVSGGFTWLEGGIFKGPNDIVVDDVWKKSRSVEVGQQVRVLDHSYNVSGIVEHGKGARVFMSFESMKELTGQATRASVFFVKVKDPAQVKEAV